MELNDLYSSRILELASGLQAGGRLAKPDASARKVSRICGSRVEVDLSLGADGVVTEYAQEVEACALGQTSAAIVAAHIVGSSADELRALRERMFAMLKADGAPPDGRWDDLKYLEPVRDFAPRHASTMLVFDAVVDCLDQIEGKRSADA